MTGGVDSVLKYNEADEEFDMYLDPEDTTEYFTLDPCVSCGGTKGYYDNDGEMVHWCGTSAEKPSKCQYCYGNLSFSNPKVRFDEMDPKVREAMRQTGTGFGNVGEICTNCYTKFRDKGLLPHNPSMEFEQGISFDPSKHWRHTDDNPVLNREQPGSDFKASYDDPFDFIWDAAILKIDPILNQRPQDLVEVIRPNYNLGYSDAGPLQHEYKMPVGKVIPILEENIDRLGKLRNRRYDQWPDVYSEWEEEPYEDSRSGRSTVESTLRELDRRGDSAKDSNPLGLVEFPQHLEQRRIARHGRGRPVSWTPWQQALAPKVLEAAMRLEDAVDSDEWMTVGHGTPTLDGNVSQMSVLPGMGGQGIGSNMLGGMLQTYGRAGDDSYSPEAYAMWNKPGHKMTEGGYGRRMAIREKPWYDGAKPRLDHVIRRKNQAGDMIYQRPVMGGSYFEEPSKWSLKGTKWGAPNPHPYSFEQIKRSRGNRINPELIGSFPLELRYEGKERKPITDMKTYVAPMGNPGFFHENAIPLKRIMDFSEKNPDSRIAQLLQEDFFQSDKGGYR